MVAPIRRRFRRSRSRALARRVALDFRISAQGHGKIEKGMQRNRVHFVYLHGLRAGEGPAFRNLIRDLREAHELVSYSEAIRRVEQGPIDRPYLCLSFDDGLASCLPASSILKEEGVSACFFVCAGLVGLAPNELRQFIPGAFGQDDGTMGWGELEKLLAAGHEIGNHTMSHRVLAEVSASEAATQISASRDALEERLGTVSHFAWPRGQFRHFSSGSGKLVRESGHASCASGVRGSHSIPAGDLYPCIRRDYVDLSWPLPHIRYFLGTSGLRSTATDNAWPTGWDIRKEGAV